MISDRIRRLRDDVMSRPSIYPERVNIGCGAWVPEANPLTRNVALWRAWRPGMSVGEARAAILLELVRLTEILVEPDWFLAGHQMAGMFFHDGGLSSENPEQVALASRLGVSPTEMEDMSRRLREWRSLRPNKVGQAAFEPGLERTNSCGTAVYEGRGWMENHSVRDFAKVLRIGFEGIRDEVRAAREAVALGSPERAVGEAFWNAALLVCQAGCLLGERYAERARELLSVCTDESEAARLRLIAETCRQVPARGARTLFEATQSLWLAHVLSCGEDGINANSIGRLDQILQPFYEADIAAGRTSREEAVELMQELACKLYLPYDVQAITLAGRRPDGSDGANEMTEIILEASRDLEIIRDLSVRVNRDTPRAIIERCAEMISRGGGIPFLFNDECFIPAMHERGIALEDARNYAPIGCIELTVPGRTNPHAVSGCFSAIKCLELTLFGGIDPVSGEAIGPATGDLTELNSYGDLWQAYRRQVEFFAERMVYLCNRGELRQQECGPLPCLSTLTDDCIRRGRDITDGGSVYNYHSICLLGTANTADSLCAIRRLVFEEKSLSPKRLLEALRNNFRDEEALRRQLLNDVPKYGNDCDEVDDIATAVANHFIDITDGFRSPLNGHYVVHLFSFLWNISYGKGLGATPDGRRAGEPIAYSLSAQQGRDEKGATAMLRSLAKLPHNRSAGATAAIVDLDPKLVSGTVGQKRLADLLESAFRMGVGQLQINVTTTERLRQAQEDPEKYGNIPVRVAGYSQLFRLLNRDLQELVIARTKHVS